MTNNRSSLWQRYHQCKARRSNTKAAKFSLAKIMPQVPHLGSLVLGVLIGIFLTSLMVFAFSTSDITLKIPTGSTIEARTTDQELTEIVGVAEPEVTKDNTKTQVIAVQEPKFDFYTELAQNHQPEVIETTVKKEPTASIKPVAAPKPQSLALKSNQKTINEYLVQAGSFRRLADADALKAKLALNGFRSKIESNKTSNGEIWSKVVLGPLPTEQSAKELQKVLKSLDVESILVLHRVENQRG